jgi:hypothetical protein
MSDTNLRSVEAIRNCDYCKRFTLHNFFSGAWGCLICDSWYCILCKRYHHHNWAMSTNLKAVVTS